MTAMKRNLPIVLTGILGAGLLYGACQLLLETEVEVTSEALSKRTSITELDSNLRVEVHVAMEASRIAIESDRQLETLVATTTANTNTESKRRSEGKAEIFRVETRIEGSVVDSAGRPLIGVSVTARLEGATRRAHRARTTNDQGRYVFENLEAGTYQLSVSDDVESVVDSVVLNKGSVVEQNLHAQSHPEFQLQVLDDIGQPLCAARIRMWGSSGHRVVSTDELGRATIPHVPAGTYSMRVMKRGYRGVSRDVELSETTRDLFEVSLGSNTLAAE